MAYSVVRESFLVWLDPSHSRIWNLAPQYGVYDVGLAKDYRLDLVA